MRYIEVISPIDVK